MHRSRASTRAGANEECGFWDAFDEHPNHEGRDLVLGTVVGDDRSEGKERVAATPESVTATMTPARRGWPPTDTVTMYDRTKAGQAEASSEWFR